MMLGPHPRPIKLEDLGVGPKSQKPGFSENLPEVVQCSAKTGKHGCACNFTPVTKAMVEFALRGSATLR